MEYTLSTKMRSTYRASGLDNLLRMGHCAPAVMQTILDVNPGGQAGLVKLMAAMPGGIGNTGFECGGITTPLVILGLRHGLREVRAGLPVIFDQGHAYFQRFSNDNAASFCKAIQNPHFPVRCIHAVRRASSSCRRFWPLFDKNPKKQKLSVGSPLKTSAAVTAEGPGRTSSGNFSRSTAFTI